MAASTAAFVITSRWNLAGTLAGAAIVPVIYILVSHGSTQGVESVGEWLRRRRSGGGEADEPGQGAGAAGGDSAAAAGHAGARMRVPIVSPAKASDRPSIYASGNKGRRPGSHARNQWLLTGLACIALGLSAYALAASDAAGTTMVKERVTQTTTARSDPETPAPETGGGGGDRPTTSTTAVSEEPSTTTESTAPADTTSTEPPTGATTAETAAGDGSSSTTDATLGSS